MPKPDTPDPYAWILIGFDPKQQELKGGVLGVVKAHYGCVEAQGRGTANPPKSQQDFIGTAFLPSFGKLYARCRFGRRSLGI